MVAVVDGNLWDRRCQQALQHQSAATAPAHLEAEVAAESAQQEEVNSSSLVEPAKLRDDGAEAVEGPHRHLAVDGMERY